MEGQVGAKAQPFERILVAVDGSDHGLHTARTAARLARALRARLTVLVVYHGPSETLGEPNYSTALGRVLAEAGDTVDAARRAVLDAGGPDPETETLSGTPAEAIVSVARDGAYDLVVVGTRGRGRLGAALLGSVSSAVAAKAGRPVVVVGHED